MSAETAKTDLARRMRSSPSWQQALWDIRHAGTDSKDAFDILAVMVLAEIRSAMSEQNEAIDLMMVREYNRAKKAMPEFAEFCAMSEDDQIAVMRELERIRSARKPRSK